jgi:hypothetical protein
MATAKVALRPNSEAARHVRQDERATTNFINHDNSNPTEFDLQSQLLADRFGVPFERSRLILALLRSGGAAI